MHRAKLTVLALVFASLTPALPGWAGVLEDPAEAPEWVSTTDTSDTYFAVVVSPDGGTVFAGGQRGLYYNSRALVRAFDAGTGELLWSFISSRERSSVAALAISPDGTRLVAGGTVYTDRSRMALWAFDADAGTSRWSATHAGNGPAHRESIVRDVVFAADGTRVLAAGTAWYAGRRRDFVVLSYGAATGRSIWKRVYDSGGAGSLGRSDEALAIGVSSNGATLIATGIGRWPAGGSQGQVLTMAFRVSNGERRWLRFDQPAGADDWQGGMGLSVRGESAFVGAQGGWNYGSGYSDVGVARLRVSDGRRIWQRALTPSGEECHLVGIAADADGLHAGATCRDGEGPRRAVAWSRQMSDGTGRWLARAGTNFLAAGLATTPAHVLVAGTEVGSPDSIRVFGLAKANGDQILVGRADDASVIYKRTLAVSPAENAAFVAGNSGNAAAVFRFDIP